MVFCTGEENGSQRRTQLELRKKIHSSRDTYEKFLNNAPYAHDSTLNSTGTPFPGPSSPRHTSLRPWHLLAHPQRLLHLRAHTLLLSLARALLLPLLRVILFLLRAVAAVLVLVNVALTTATGVEVGIFAGFVCGASVRGHCSMLFPMAQRRG